MAHPFFLFSRHSSPQARIAFHMTCVNAANIADYHYVSFLCVLAQVTVVVKFLISFFILVLVLEILLLYFFPLAVPGKKSAVSSAVGALVRCFQPLF